MISSSSRYDLISCLSNTDVEAEETGTEQMFSQTSCRMPEGVSSFCQDVEEGAGPEMCCRGKPCWVGSLLVAVVAVRVSARRRLHGAPLKNLSVSSGRLLSVSPYSVSFPVNLLDSRSVMGDLEWVAYPKNGVSPMVTEGTGPRECSDV